MSEKWSISPVNMTTFSKIISLTIIPYEINTKYYSNSMLYEQIIISKLFSRFHPQDSFPGDIVVSLDSGSEENFLSNGIYDSQWQEYVNNLSFVGLKKLLENIIRNNNTVPNLLEKIQFLQKNFIIKKNSYLTLKLVDLSIQANLTNPNDMLLKVYSRLNSLQKTALIGRYPKHFATKPVERVKTTDPWIKLAEVTNLLTICKIEVPAIGSELSDPKILTKYLEKAETLLKDCNRINK